MAGTSTIFRISFVLGLVVMGFWASKQLGLHSPSVRRATPQPHSHGNLELPKPHYPSSGPDQKIPDYGLLPRFQLTESLGEPISRKTLLNKVWVASFLFTRCGGTCPTTARQTRILQDSLPEGALLVSISVDPTNDTLETLQTYAKGFGRKPGLWLLATGDAHQIEKLASQGFHLGAAGSLFHSTRLGLVDRRGHFRGFYESTDAEAMKRLVRDISLVLAAPAKKR